MSHLPEAAELIKHARDLRDTWQGRAMAVARGRMAVVMASVLAHNYDAEATAILFSVIRPQCWDAAGRTLRTPFLCSAGKVDKRGHIVADVIWTDGQLPTRKVLFVDERDFEYEFRKLADLLKLSDADRVALFAAAKNWVVCDYRLDPTMDPKDPDAKRLVLH